MRKLIGGGELSTFQYDMDHRRVGGCFYDAMFRLGRTPLNGGRVVLRNVYTLEDAWDALSLREELYFRLDRENFSPAVFNQSATPGPVLSRNGIRSKEGVQEGLLDICEMVVSKLKEGDSSLKFGVLFSSSVGYRTKLMDKEEIIKRFEGREPHGRAIFMVDAIEQFISNPLMEVLNNYTFAGRLTKDSPFKNKVVRHSTDWRIMGDILDQYPVAITGDWSSFDLRRPSDDVLYGLELMVRRFKPRNRLEETFLTFLLRSYHNSFKRHSLVMPNGSVMEYEGGVPSGCSFTSLLDTALNTLYLRHAVTSAGIPAEICQFWCNGDDFVILTHEIDMHRLGKVKDNLDDMFDGGITDFMIHKEDKKAKWVQAVFPEGTDLSKGTRNILDKAVWKEVDNDVVIDDSKGLSHRIHLYHRWAVKFNGYHWGPANTSVRDTHSVLVRLLHPEGIDHTCMDYMRRCLNFAGDNCFNDNVINKLVYRVYGALTILMLEGKGVPLDMLVALAGCKYTVGDVYPFGSAFWFRKVSGKVNIDNDPSYAMAKDMVMKYVSMLVRYSTLPPKGDCPDYVMRDMINRGARWAIGRTGSPNFGEMKDYIDKAIIPLAKYQRKESKGKRPPLVGPELREVRRRVVAIMRDYIFVWQPIDSPSLMRWLSKRENEPIL